MMITGGRFNQGDMLLRVDARDYQNALSSAQSTLTRAIAEQDFAQKEYTRLTAVYEKKLASDTQLQQAKRSVEIANAAVIAAQAGLEQAQRNLERTEIKAPFTGRVREESIDLGQVVMRGGQLGELYATDAVEVRLPIADSQLRFLDPAIISTGVYDTNTAPMVELSANFAGEEQRWVGRVVRAEGEIDQRSRLVHLVARVQNDQSDNANPLPVGLFVNAEIKGNTVADLVRVPRTAIRANNQVLIVAPDNTLRFRTVKVLRFEGVDALISDGLQAGEQVAISALQFVVDGMPVIVQN
jgi:RND family efflux transporter MFP subunit